MPRVVENQMEIFRTDPLFSQLAQGTPIRYAGCLHGKDHERRQHFAQQCANRKLQITLPNHGVNFDLALQKVHEHANNELSFESELIFNGVCIRLSGRLNRASLVGQARVEFNAERAAAEEDARQRGERAHAQRIAELRNAILQ
ncbi:hypothetical protein M3Y99_00516200 [Aphelenchoides fujianensis]|nr:hypothetical protein M3Y99_00516200 [Aphelenchoides fujianensis]